MILEYMQKPPYIHFGLGKQALTVKVGASVTVWQDKLLNDLTQIEQITTNLPFTLVSKNKFLYLANTLGTHNIQIRSHGTRLTIPSNVIVLTVVP